MSVQTDVVVANLEEAQAIANSDGPAAIWNGFTFNGFDRVQICSLLSILKTGDPLADFDTYLDRIPIVGASDGDWPVVSILVHEILAELSQVAAMEELEFETLALAWAKTGEFEGWAQSDVRHLLRDFVDLADSAVLEDKCLMLWQIV